MTLRATMAVLAAGAAAAAMHGPAMAADADMQTVADRIAIEDMMVRYYAELASGDHQLSDYFREDAVFMVNGQVWHGREAIQGLYDGMGGGEQPERTDTDAVAHMLLTNPVIDVDGDTATASFIWTQVRNPTIDGEPEFVEQGREYDYYVRENGDWRIAKRAVIADSPVPAGMQETWTRSLDYDITSLE